MRVRLLSRTYGRDFDAAIRERVIARRRLRRGGTVR